MKGKRIRTLQQLAKAAQERKSVVPCERHFADCTPKPAEFVMHRQASWVAKLLHCGLYIYHPERKKKAASGAPAVRNPEGIDFNLYPIPEGYTVADDVPNIVPGDWMLKVGAVGWRHVRTGLIQTFCDNWTYLRPLRRGEKGVRV